MCTHLLLEAEGLADQVVMLEAGRDLVSASPGELVQRYWPHPTVVVEADGAALDGVGGLAGVLAAERNGTGTVVTLDRTDRVPDLVAALVAAGARIRRVTPHEPSLEELYFVVRRRGPEAAGAPS